MTRSFIVIRAVLSVALCVTLTSCIGSDSESDEDTGGTEGGSESDGDEPNNNSGPSCIKIDRLSHITYPPAAVRVTFRVLDCDRVRWGVPVQRHQHEQERL